jgi:leader peptidase (prepilin peptidase)/N-methyltransferase
VLAQFFLLAALVVFGTIAWLDARTHFIPDALNVALFVLAVLAAWGMPSFPLVPSLIGAGVFAAQWYVSRGKWVGSADILLGASIGLLLGSVMSLLIALACAYVGATAVSLPLSAAKKLTMKSAVPLAPFLFLGTVIAWLYGGAIASYFVWP